VCSIDTVNEKRTSVFSCGNTVVRCPHGTPTLPSMYILVGCIGEGRCQKRGCRLQGANVDNKYLHSFLRFTICMVWFEANLRYSPGRYVKKREGEKSRDRHTRIGQNSARNQFTTDRASRAWLTKVVKKERLHIQRALDEPLEEDPAFKGPQMRKACKA
jgi:hypothetical protein